MSHVWQLYLNKHNEEPRNAFDLLNFSRSTRSPLTYEHAKRLYNSRSAYAEKYRSFRTDTQKCREIYARNNQNRRAEHSIELDNIKSEYSIDNITDDDDPTSSAEDDDSISTSFNVVPAPSSAEAHQRKHINLLQYGRTEKHINPIRARRMRQAELISAYWFRNNNDRLKMSVAPLLSIIAKYSMSGAQSLADTERRKAMEARKQQREAARKREARKRKIQHTVKRCLYGGSHDGDFGERCEQIGVRLYFLCIFLPALIYFALLVNQSIFEAGNIRKHVRLYQNNLTLGADGTVTVDNLIIWYRDDPSWETSGGEWHKPDLTDNDASKTIAYDLGDLTPYGSSTDILNFNDEMADEGVSFRRETYDGWHWVKMDFDDPAANEKIVRTQFAYTLSSLYLCCSVGNDSDCAQFELFLPWMRRWRYKETVQKFSLNVFVPSVFKLNATWNWDDNQRNTSLALNASNEIGDGYDVFVFERNGVMTQDLAATFAAVDGSKAPFEFTSSCGALKRKFQDDDFFYRSYGFDVGNGCYAEFCPAATMTAYVWIFIAMVCGGGCFCCLCKNVIAGEPGSLDAWS